jgi:outer membrane protein assembly factor BamA
MHAARVGESGRIRRYAAPTLLFFLIIGIGNAVRIRAAQNETARLAAVQASGSRWFGSAEIAAASGLVAGMRVHKEDFQAAADRLGALGAFSNVRFRFTSKGDEVSVELLVEDAPEAPVAFDNFPWLTDDEIEQGLRQSVLLFHGSEAPQGGTLLDTMGAALEKMLAVRGVKASVQHALVSRPEDGVLVMRFQVTGVALAIGSVEFQDSLAAKDTRIQQRLPDLVGKPYSRDAVGLFNLEQVRPVYLENGFLRVQLGPAQARFTGNPNAPLPDKVLVFDPITPGRKYSWSGAAWSGNSALTAAALDEAVRMKSGDPADGMKIEGGWDRAREEYGKLGYLDVKLEPSASFDDENGTVSYSVAVTEGPQYRMGQLVLTGISLEGERKVRSGWKIAPGGVLDKSYYDVFLAHGARDALGKVPAHTDNIGHFLRKNPQAATVDVMLDFE